MVWGDHGDVTSNICILGLIVCVQYLYVISSTGWLSVTVMTSWPYIRFNSTDSSKDLPTYYSLSSLLKTEFFSGSGLIREIQSCV